MSSHHRAINAPQVEVNLAVTFRTLQQTLVDTFPKAFIDPASETVVNSLPFTEFLRQISPRTPCFENPENSADRLSVLRPGSAPLARSLGRQEMSDCIPLSIREMMTGHLASSLIICGKTIERLPDVLFFSNTNYETVPRAKTPPLRTWSNAFVRDSGCIDCAKKFGK